MNASEINCIFIKNRWHVRRLINEPKKPLEIEARRGNYEVSIVAGTKHSYSSPNEPSKDFANVEVRVDGPKGNQESGLHGYVTRDRLEEIFRCPSRFS